MNATSGYKYKDTPNILLKGEYLNACGFSIGTQLTVTLSNDKNHYQKSTQINLHTEQTTFAIYCVCCAGTLEN